jgi:AcrR family transcriptional regulator
MINTRDNIIAAAVKVWNDDETAGLLEISEMAGINKRTIHRYFKDRETLLTQCKETMMSVCNQAMNEAYNSSREPTLQIENMFFAAFEFGNAYIFLKKLYRRTSYTESEVGAESGNDDVKAKWFRLIAGLQKAGKIDKGLPLPWIFNVFGGMIDIAVAARETGDVAPNQIRELAWKSFKGSIGLVTQ